MTLKKKKTKKKRCARCKKTLGGVAYGSSSQIRKLPKSKKVPERKYAGILCANCLENLLRYKVRFEAKFSYPEKFKELELRRDLTLEKFLPQGWYSELSKKRKK